MFDYSRSKRVEEFESIAMNGSEFENVMHSLQSGFSLLWLDLLSSCDDLLSLCQSCKHNVSGWTPLSEVCNRVYSSIAKFDLRAASSIKE